jgi:uncharacterized protein YbjT (DUF2867 family)
MNSSSTDPDQRTVVVCGATGYLGGHVARALHADGWRVRALVRDPSRLGDTAEYCDEVFVGHPTDPTTIEGLFDGADAAFSSIGVRSFRRSPSFRDVDELANLHLVDAAERAGVDRFVFVSILRGDEFRDRSPLIDARERVVDRLRVASMSSTIIRPTGFFNDMAAFRQMAERGRVWLIGDDQTRINPIHGADLADVIRQAAASDDTTDRNVGGPDVLTQSEIANLAFDAADRPTRVTRVPSRLVTAIGRLIGPLNPNAGANLRMFAVMGEHDMVGEPVGSHHLADEYRQARGDATVAAGPHRGGHRLGHLPAGQE